MTDAWMKRYEKAKRAAIGSRFSRMNPEQAQAVFQVKGPLLILAGAGSGKTTVVVNRIANMVEFGDGYHSDWAPEGLTEEDVVFLEDYAAGKTDDYARMRSLTAHHPVRPWNILAITFTNKAAGELKERLQGMLGDQAEEIQASTFHSACVRILRSRIGLLEGYSSSFTIYDSDDSIRLVKEGLAQVRAEEKAFAPRSVLSAISAAKDRFLSPRELLKEAGGDYRLEVTAKVYDYYQKRLRQANAVDFDDIILLAVRILEQFPEALEYYQNRFRYIMVDEYQDTNNAQYRLVSLLAQSHHNLCVVGDDDQSIYKFRGATIENILSFEHQFPGCTVVKLEQNYRCTQRILDAANSVISHNTQRKGKELWTKNGEGEKIQVYRALDEMDEGRFIADTILSNVKNGEHYKDHAILYRMNAQSNTIERSLVRAGISYRIIGGVRFYERQEIKDVMAYLSVIANPADRVRLKRILNVPKRGIGDATVSRAEEIADMLGISLFEVLEEADRYQPLQKKSSALESFAALIRGLQELADALPLDELLEEVLERTGYLEMLISQGEEGLARRENVEELKSNVLKYMEDAGEGEEPPTLEGFLEEVTLYNDLDAFNENEDYVVMMTMHSAKGLEFPNVFFCGAEEGIFPGIQSQHQPEQIEEERRLAYVCITRAKKRLCITTAAQRMLFGTTMRNRASRFLGEIPLSLCDVEDKTVARSYLHPETHRAPAARPGGGVSRKIGVGGGAAASGGKEPFTLKVGDRVRHKAFGEGTLEKITPMGGDHLLEVRFDSVGVKKIMATYAKMEKL